MLQLSGKRDFVKAVCPPAVAAALTEELKARGAQSVAQEGYSFRVAGLRVQDHNSPPLLLDNLVVQYYEGSSCGLSYDATAEVQYPGSYLALWALPCVLAIVYGALVSPVVLLVLPLGALAIKALLPFIARMWFEELFHAIERKALVLNPKTGA